MNQDIGKWTILAGILIAIGGIIWYFFGDKLGFLGNLPGDFKVEKENFRFYFTFCCDTQSCVTIHHHVVCVYFFFSTGTSPTTAA